jgi:hypothetical protein
VSAYAAGRTLFSVAGAAVSRLASRLRSHAGRIGSRRKLRVKSEQVTSTKDVVAFSLYGSGDRYVRGALMNVDAFRRYFPEFVCRFYVGADIPDRLTGELIDAGAEVIVMHARGVDATYMFWRFLVAEDMRKRVYLIRDIDAIPGPRDRMLHDRWIASGRTWQVIRDHYSHNMRIMGGLWGGHTRPSFLTARLGHLWRFGNHYNRDQKFLSSVIWPLIRHDVLVQDHLLRFADESPLFHSLDTEAFSCIGEIATDTAERDRWRAELRRLHYERTGAFMVS